MDNLNNDNNKVFLITFSSASKSYVINELHDILVTNFKMKDIAEEIMLIENNSEFEEIANIFKENSPVFIRHICPCQIEVPAKISIEDIACLGEKANEIMTYLDKNITFSVQTRITVQDEKPPYGNFDINKALSDIFISNGFELDIRKPEQVISVLCTSEKIYVGVSKAEDNLSDWAGGTRRFSREDGQLSRSEFKLLEAIEVFKLKLPAEGRALDLGAAPGGWTRVLLNRGLRVVSVDPALLDERIIRDPGVVHYRGKAQDYFHTQKDKFDVIVNDMRMDVGESSEMMLIARNFLKSNGFAIITLKLLTTGMQKTVKRALKELSEGYDIIGARQLFHNRNEVTIAMKKK